ncbi:MAG TPA: MerC domain-containing protein [Xanthomonadaceae bacterium]|nr:MerC domain-containing protein [Xanthomonadaceae bacterium]
MSASFEPVRLPIARKGLLDRLGATGSMLCAIHCAALPLVLAIAPAFGAWFGSARFEIGFIAFASVLGLASLVLGYRQHRVGRALLFLVPGIALLWCAVLLDVLHANPIVHAVAMACGGTLIATAHVLNLRLTHAHAHGVACQH